jgi:hypothetical protein
MAEEVFTMNELLQDKAKELQKGPTSKNATRLEEFRVRNFIRGAMSRRLICSSRLFLQGMSDALHVIIDSMQEALESVEKHEQDSAREGSPALRSRAKRRKVA